MPKYTPWTWSAPHGRHYSYLIADDGTTVLDTLWAGPSAASAASTTETTSDSTPRSQTSARYSKTSASSSHGSSLGANYTYAKQGPPGSTHEEEDEEEDADEGDDDGEEGEGEEDPASAAQAATVAARPDSAIASYTPQQASYASAYAKTRQPSVSQTSQYSNYQYAATQYGASSAYQTHTQYSSNNQYQSPRNAISTLPLDVQATIGYKDRRFIQTGADRNETEQLDTRYRRVSKPHHAFFFTPGRVFKMLWIEPAGQANPGKTRNSTHFSTVWCGEQAYSEIRRFIVVRNKGSFSQCIPIQTYKGRGATKPGLVMHDHGVIHTTLHAPNLILGENLTKFSIRVEPTANEVLEPQSRVNYGKAYAVEHNVKVLDIGMVVEGHRYLIEMYFDSAMRGQ